MSSRYIFLQKGGIRRQPIRILAYPYSLIQRTVLIGKFFLRIQSSTNPLKILQCKGALNFLCTCLHSCIASCMVLSLSLSLSLNLSVCACFAKSWLSGLGFVSGCLEASRIPLCRTDVDQTCVSQESRQLAIVLICFNLFLHGHACATASQLASCTYALLFFFTINYYCCYPIYSLFVA